MTPPTPMTDTDQQNINYLHHEVLRTDNSTHQRLLAMAYLISMLDTVRELWKN